MQSGVSIVLPAYNETQNLTPLILETTKTLDNTEYEYEIIIVDDGSTDTTRDTIKHLSELFSMVRGVVLSRNYGQTPALRAGITHAQHDIIVTMDADGQNDPTDIPTLITELVSDPFVDCVNGYRKHRNDPLIKRIPSLVQTYLAWLTGPRIHDYGCTLSAYTTTALKSVDLRGENHRYIPSMLHDNGYQVREVVVNHRARENGSSHYGITRLLNGFVDLLFHAVWNKYSSRPLHFFGVIGLLLMGSGFFLGMHALLLKYVFGVELTQHLPRLILIIGLVIFGFQVLVMAYVSEVLSRLVYRDVDEYRVSDTIGFTTTEVNRADTVERVEM